MTGAGMSASAVGALVTGLLLVVASGAAWSGRWRWWMQDRGRGHFVLSAMPGTGLMLFGLGIYMVVPTYPVALVGGVGMAAAVVGYVLFFCEPSWFGPAWYRRVKRRSSSLGYRGGHPEPRRKPQGRDGRGREPR